MTRIAVILGRLFLITAGYAAACLSASLLINILYLAMTGAVQDWSLPLASTSLVFSIPFVALFIGYFAFIPGIPAIMLGEFLGRRDWLFYALAGGAVGLAVAAFLGLGIGSYDYAQNPLSAATMAGAGIVGGVAYWITAGRLAGSWRRAQPSRPTSPGPSGS